MTQALTLDEMLAELAFYDFDEMLSEPGLEPRCTVAAIEEPWHALSALLDDAGRGLLFDLDAEHNTATARARDFMLRVGLGLAARLQASRDGGEPMTAAGVAAALVEAGRSVEREAFELAATAKLEPLERALARLEAHVRDVRGDDA